jgi:hypothetical protein
MAVRDIFKFTRKTFFNPTAWMDWNRLAEQNSYFFNVLKNIFSPDQPQTQRSFEEAMQEYGLTEADVADGIATYRTLAFVFLVFGLCAFFYAIYLVFRYSSVTGSILAIAVAALLFTQSFKYDFWALQMRRRHLGLTFADWKRQYLGD